MVHSTAPPFSIALHDKTRLAPQQSRPQKETGWSIAPRSLLVAYYEALVALRAAISSANFSIVPAFLRTFIFSYARPITVLTV